MDEYFLQYLWNFQKFTQTELLLTDGSLLQVFSPGFQNFDSGPDFKEAKIKIDNLVWSGSVEVHFKSSDWQKHQHQHDAAYANVILHVVWAHDQDILLDNKPIPTLVLSKYVIESVELAYKHYINQPTIIRCSKQLQEISQLQIISMMDKALSDRLKTKSRTVLNLLDQNTGDWEETTYQVILQNFGFKINQHAFNILAHSIPYKIINKYKNNAKAVEALLFGMSGYLSDISSKYGLELQEEFNFLKEKHGLSVQLKKHHWNRSRMRPANFPSVRIAQLSALLTHKSQLFAQLLDIQDHQAAVSFFRNNVSSYWESHYDFDKPAKKSIHLGTSAMNNLIINSLIPILAANAKYLDEVKYLDRAQSILEHIPAEKNNIIDKWKTVGIAANNGFESQALIHQYNLNCKAKKCLQCNIGISILSPKFTP